MFLKNSNGRAVYLQEASIIFQEEANNFTTSSYDAKYLREKLKADEIVNASSSLEIYVNIRNYTHTKMRHISQ